jgi:hypothetical protein
MKRKKPLSSRCTDVIQIYIVTHPSFFFQICWGVWFMARNDEICYMELGNVKNNHLNQPIPDFLENKTKLLKLCQLKIVQREILTINSWKLLFLNHYFFRLKIKEFFLGNFSTNFFLIFITSSHRESGIESERESSPRSFLLPSYRSISLVMQC